MRACAASGQGHPTKYRIKLSGDGAKMTRLTGFIVISFSILNDENTVLSPMGWFVVHYKSTHGCTVLFN